MENTEIPMAERLTAVQNFGFLVKIPIAESLTPVQVFCFLVIYALLSWVGFLPPCCHGRKRNGKIKRKLKKLGIKIGKGDTCNNTWSNQGSGK